MVNAVHHVTLSVSSVDASVAWYQRLLGEAEIVERTGEGWRRIRMTWPGLGGLRIGVMSHDAAPEGRFSHLQRGLDHLGLDCSTPDEVAGWAARMDELGIEHGPVEDVAYAWAVTARDPDGIPLEFFCAK